MKTEKELWAAIAPAWHARVSELGLKKGTVKYCDQSLAFLQGAIAVATLAGLLSHDRAGQIGFMVAIDRVQSVDDLIVKEELIVSDKTTALYSFTSLDEIAQWLDLRAANAKEREGIHDRAGFKPQAERCNAIASELHAVAAMVRASRIDPNVPPSFRLTNPARFP